MAAGTFLVLLVLITHPWSGAELLWFFVLVLLMLITSLVHSLVPRFSFSRSVRFRMARGVAKRKRSCLQGDVDHQAQQGDRQHDLEHTDDHGHHLQ
ncbi:uncharacterized protein G2W53_021941 [Senna tora]|uniref:Uncharacterized protein n=1 Tax=Senna tora TaxID=362788 RepID=A0A834TKD4_9FABA|nr:uncharacterized protein G2W53_021941 [Senna tora]